MIKDQIGYITQGYENSRSGMEMHACKSFVLEDKFYQTFTAESLLGNVWLDLQGVRDIYIYFLSHS